MYRQISMLWMQTATSDVRSDPMKINTEGKTKVNINGAMGSSMGITRHPEGWTPFRGLEKGKK